MVEYRSDNMYVKAYTSGAQDQYMINKFTDVPANSLNAATWTDLYSTILKCNEVISRIGGVTTTATFTPAIRNQYEGEARFIRAFYYFTLVRLYGGVPLVETPISDKEALVLKRADIPTTYQFIENDLKLAVTQLPTTYAATDLGRVKQSAAKALLAKVYMTEGNFTAALPVLNDVITTGGYSLQTAVANVFSVSNEMNSEVVFAIRFDKAIAGTGHGAWFSPGSDQTTSEVNAALINTYNTADARKALLGFTKTGTVYYINKYFDTQDPTQKTFDNDFIALRYADVLLMYAECLNETAATLSTDPTDTNGALYWLNLVRKRSLPTAPILPTQYSTQDGLRQLIQLERWLEFPLEGHRWFDLVRTKTAKTQVLLHSGIGAAPVADVPDYRLIFPVPDAEVEKINNKNIFPQNQGYQ